MIAGRSVNELLVGESGPKYHSYKDSARIIDALREAIKILRYSQDSEAAYPIADLVEEAGKLLKKFDEPG